MSEQNKDVIVSYVKELTNEPDKYELLKDKADKYEKALKEIVYTYEHLYININGGGDFRNAISNVKQLIGYKESEE